MSAELLREAAALMRERAENSAVGWTGPLTWGSNFTDAEKHTLTWQHYNSWHPAVALAVADLLEVLSWFPSSADPTDLKVAERVAAAYLGAEVPA